MDSCLNRTPPPPLYLPAASATALHVTEPSCEKSKGAASSSCRIEQCLWQYTAPANVTVVACASRYTKGKKVGCAQLETSLVVCPTHWGVGVQHATKTIYIPASKTPDGTNHTASILGLFKPVPATRGNGKQRCSNEEECRNRCTNAYKKQVRVNRFALFGFLTLVCLVASAFAATQVYQWAYRRPRERDDHIGNQKTRDDCSDSEDSLASSAETPMGSETTLSTRDPSQISLATASVRIPEGSASLDPSQTPARTTSKVDMEKVSLENPGYQRAASSRSGDIPASRRSSKASTIASLPQMRDGKLINAVGSCPFGNRQVSDTDERGSVKQNRGRRPSRDSDGSNDRADHQIVRPTDKADEGPRESEWSDVVSLSDNIRGADSADHEDEKRHAWGLFGGHWRKGSGQRSLKGVLHTSQNRVAETAREVRDTSVRFSRWVKHGSEETLRPAQQATDTTSETGSIRTTKGSIRRAMHWTRGTIDAMRWGSGHEDEPSTLPQATPATLPARKHERTLSPVAESATASRRS